MGKISVCDSVAASTMGLRLVMISLIFWQALMIVLLGTCAKVAYFDDNADFNNRYQHFTGVEIMMFIGFGYLMTFLKRYGMGALGLSMLITVLGLEWGIWIEVSVCITVMLYELLLLNTLLVMLVVLCETVVPRQL